MLLAIAYCVVDIFPILLRFVKIDFFELGVVVHAFDASTREAEAGEL